MKVTFLIGNGFDLNLGLETRYSDFLKEYKNPQEGDSAFIRHMKDKMQSDEKLWSNAEIALGESTVEIKTDNDIVKLENVRSFSDFHIDYCVKMAAYLEKQQERIPDLENSDNLVRKLANCLANFLSGLRTDSRQRVRESYSGVFGGISYNFIVFNYTEILDSLIEKSKGHENYLGQRKFQNTNFANSFGSVIHVHGTTKEGMVFGVNDISQIANRQAYSDMPEEYLRQLIKVYTNQDNEEQTDERAHQLLVDSDLIYIYGMSLGETDKLWWDRICRIMRTKPNLCLIVHSLDCQDDSLIRTKHLTFVREFREKFVNYSPKLTNEEKAGIEKRIFITSYNLFHEFKNIAVDNSKSESKGGIREIRHSDLSA